MTPLFALLNLNPAELAVLALLGVLLFGRRLPEVGRYLGKGIIEFKKGMKGLEDEIDTGSHTAARTSDPAPTPALDQPRPPQRVPTSVPKFEDAPVSAAPKFEETAPPKEQIG